MSTSQTFEELLRRRRMTRWFLANPVEPALLEEIARVITRAPSGAYAQGQHLLIVTDPRKRSRITEFARPFASWVAEAPAMLLLVASEAAYRDRFTYGGGRGAEWPVPFWYVDAGAALMLILLAAADRGLGAGVFGVPADGWSKIEQLVALPDEHHLVALIALGYAADDATSEETTRFLSAGRVPLSARIHWDGWCGGRDRKS